MADASPADGRQRWRPRSPPSPPSPRPRRESGPTCSRRAFELLHERIDDLALLMTLEMGKPLAEARGEIAYAAEFFRHFAERGSADRRRLPDRAGRQAPASWSCPRSRSARAC